MPRVHGLHFNSSFTNVQLTKIICIQGVPHDNLIYVNCLVSTTIELTNTSLMTVVTTFHVVVVGARGKGHLRSTLNTVLITIVITWDYRAPECVPTPALVTTCCTRSSHHSSWGGCLQRQTVKDQGGEEARDPEDRTAGSAKPRGELWLGLGIVSVWKRIKQSYEQNKEKSKSPLLQPRF